MITAYTPKERATAIRALRQYLPSIQDRIGPATDFLDQLLRQAELSQYDALDFELHADGRCSVAGKMLPSDGRGLTLAWLVLACEQHRIDAPQVADVSSARRPWVTSKAMFNRAAQQVERTNTDLATAIRAIGTERGRFVLNHPVRGVRCTSTALARIFAPR